MTHDDIFEIRSHGDFRTDLEVMERLYDALRESEATA